MSVRSLNPPERSNWRWVPSPQSIRIRSAPRRTSSAGSPRRALGTDPAVPANITENSIAAERSAPAMLTASEAVTPRPPRP